MNIASPPTTGSPPVGETVRDVATRSAEEAKQLSHEVLDGVRNLMRTGRTEVRDQIDQQTARAAGASRSAATQLLALADGDIAHADRAQALARDLGQRLSQLAERLETGGFDSFSQDAGMFARRRPVAFLAAVATAGFVAGRYAKVLMSRDDDTSGSGSGSGSSHGAGYSDAPTEVRSPTAQPIAGLSSGVDR